MKFTVPLDCHAVVHEGTTLPIDSDGAIEAPESLALVLAVHGVAAGLDRPAAPAWSTVDVDAMSRTALIAALKDAGEPRSSSTSLAELRTTLRQTLASRLP